MLEYVRKTVVLFVLPIILIAMSAFGQVPKAEFVLQNGHSSSVESVSFSFDGKMLASGSEDQTVKFWDVSSGNLIRSLEGHSSYVTSVSISFDDKTLASGSWDKTVK
ncbi:MAG: hypothetical protein JXK07_06245, partial [Spirochaetes bacterium]|nr:hypothetical protein [Spirochaetota bacterium]